MAIVLLVTALPPTSTIKDVDRHTARVLHELASSIAGVAALAHPKFALIVLPALCAAGLIQRLRSLPTDANFVDDGSAHVIKS